MYATGEPATVSFFYGNASGQPLSGQSLTAIVRQGNGAWASAGSSPLERSPAIAPGVYDLNLTAAEMNSDTVSWYVRTGNGEFVAQGQLQTTEGGQTMTDTVRTAVYAEPADQDDRTMVCSFLDHLADHILRRAMSNAERSTHGDAVGTGSLVGVMSLLTQGQLVVTNCNGDSYIFLNSSIQGNPPLGTLRVVRNSAGVPMGVLPLTGPNSAPDATSNCNCPS